MTKQTFQRSSLLILSISVCTGIALAQTPSDPAEAEPKKKWDITIGLGAQNQPISPGIDDDEVQVLPYLDIIYKDRYFLNSQNGLGTYLYKHEDRPTALFEDLAFGAAIDFDPGRDPEDLASQSPLRGLGQIDATLEGKLFADAELSFVELGAVLAHDLADGHNGWYSEVSAEVTLPIARRGFFSFGPTLRYASDSYQQSYYGVNAQEAMATGLAEYAPEAGFDRASFILSSGYAVTRAWRVLGQIEYQNLLGDAKDSPFVEEEGQTVISLAIARQF